MLNTWDEAVVCAAWSFCALWLVAWGLPWLAHSLRDRRPATGDRSPAPDRADAAALLALFAAAFALRATLPWGPVSFTEAERLAVLWHARPEPPERMVTVPTLLALLRAAHVPALALMRYGGPAFGALGVAGTYLLARAADVRREAAVLAAVIVLGWPSHIHYSTAMTFSVEGPALWALAFAATLRRAPLPWRAPVVAALAVLGVYARPEYRLLLVPLGVLTLAPGWTWRRRAALLACLLLGLAPYADYLVPGSEVGEVSGDSGFFLPLLLGDVTMGPAWWLYLGALGLASGGRRRLPLRAALGLAVAALVVSYWFLGSDSNVRWSQWRYYVSIVPSVAVAAALAADALADRAPFPRRALLTAAALSLLPLLAYLRALRRPEDLRAEFAYLRESAPRVMASRPDVLMLANRGHPERRDVAVEGNPAMAIATAGGPREWPGGCGEGTRVRDLERVVEQCPETIHPDRTAVYLGLALDDARLEGVRRRYRLAPIDERLARVVLTSTMSNRQCRRSSDPAHLGDVDGLWFAACAVRLGWYRLEAR